MVFLRRSCPHWQNTNLLTEKASKETAPFQEFMSAATAVFQFITKHQASQTRTDKSQNKELLKTFEASNGVNYNKGNITFHIEPAKTDLWIKCLAKKLSEPVLLTNGSGYQMKDSPCILSHKEDIWQYQCHCLAHTLGWSAQGVCAGYHVPCFHYLRPPSSSQ